MTAISLYEQAGVLCLEGDVTGAVEALRAGILDGLWWRPDLLEDPDLAGLRSRPEYGDILKACQSRFPAAQAAARPECLVIAPASTPWEPRTLFVIHWWGDTAAAFAARWKRLVDEGWTLVVPQSSQMCCSQSYCWDDAEKARSELRRHLEDCSTRRGLPLAGMVIAGASQGAPLAMELAHESGVPWLCVVPSFPEGYDVSPLVGVPGHSRGAFLLGELDPANERARLVMEALRGASVQWTQSTMQDVGHDMPEGFAAQAAEVLRQLRAEE